MTIKRQIQTIPSFIRKAHSARVPLCQQLDPYKPLAAIYLLRLVLGLKRNMTIYALGELFEDGLGDLTGLADADVSGNHQSKTDEISFDFESAPAAQDNKTKLIQRVRKRLKHLLSAGMAVNAPLFDNLQRIADKFNLNAVEQEILVIRLLIGLYPTFASFINQHCCDCTENSLPEYLRILTTRPIADIKKNLAPTCSLRQLGWLEVMPQALDLENKLRLPPTLLEILMTRHDSIDHLLDRFFMQATQTFLQVDDFSGLKSDLDIVIPYLESVLKSRQTGVNLLIHGTADSGKLELVKALAQRVNADLFEICRSGHDGVDLSGHDRLSSCNMTQHWLAKQAKPGLILFDEAEDVLPRRASSTPFTLEEADPFNWIELNWLDRQFEQNPVPVIWIVNKTWGIEPAYLRRFDYFLELDSPPLALRRRQIDQATHELNVRECWREQLAKRSDISQGRIDKAAAVARHIRQKTGVASERIIERVLNANNRVFQQALAFNPIEQASGYDLSFTQCNIQLSELLEGLKRNPAGNFCFYGAPGTGKTAFANHLAEQLGLPLLIKRASDILGKYVGQTERNIASMFHQAQHLGAILLFDEADSLLSDRRDARQTWEVSQVNEMLAQMERFNGIFICTTNLMDKFDVASLRRFDFKVKFDYLNSEQRWALFQQESLRLGADLPENDDALFQLKQQIYRLTQLTPGDFAILTRQARLLGGPMNLDNIVSVLEQECLAKGEAFSRIGFVH